MSREPLALRVRSALVACGLPAYQHRLTSAAAVGEVLAIVWEAQAIADKAGAGRRVREHTSRVEVLLEELQAELFALERERQHNAPTAIPADCRSCGKPWPEWRYDGVSRSLGLEYRTCCGATFARELPGATDAA